MELSRRVSSISSSATLTINAKAQELKKRGVKVISFAVGEPDFETPEHIKQMAIQAVLRNQNRYTPVGGILELREAVCSWVKANYGLDYKPEEVMVSCGGKQAIYNVLQAIINPGDEVIIPSPYWVSYPDMVILAGGVPKFLECPAEDSYKLKPEALEKAITPETKAIIINSPSNPTGVHYKRDELKEIAEVLKKNSHLFIISDDIYSSILFSGNEWINVVMVEEELRDRTIIIHGVSKTYAMTGWRIGYAIAHRDIIKAATKIQSQSTSNPCSIAQWASVAALTGDQSMVRGMVESFQRRCKYVMERLNNIEGIKFVEPQGAFYIFPDVSSFYGKRYGSYFVRDSLSMCEYLMDEAHVAAVPGSAFGDDKSIRLSYAISVRDLEEGLDRIERALKNLS